MYDLETPTGRDQLGERIREDINVWCAAAYDEGHRKHLGASIMGEECSRYLYNTFHWMQKEKFDGRMRRLFQVGHTAEPRLISYLKGIGFTIWETDPSTGKQFRISGGDGHYGGSIDGICTAPAHYGINGDILFLNEFKTNNTGAGFESVRTKPLAMAKPKHWAQMCQYGYKLNIHYGCYIIENKNDSELQVKIVKLDWLIGKQLEDRAISIIQAKEPPPKISHSIAYFDCKHCKFKGVCHKDHVPDKNCRSCVNSTPVENGQWFCRKWNANIPDDAIPVGCDDWVAIK